MANLKTLLEEDGDIICTDGGSNRLTITAGLARGSDIPCLSAWVQSHANNTGAIRVLISATDDCTLAGQTAGIKIDDLTELIEIKLNNLNLLSFRGTNNGDIIDILYRKR
jgi:hypothetical protein